jgi:hypothetical protein
MRTLESMRQGSLWMRLFPALWMRWAISIIVGVAAIVALVAFVDRNNNNSEARGSTQALERENQQAQALVGADQAPRTFVLKAGRPLRQAFVAAVRSDIDHRIKTGNVQGRVQRIDCRHTGTQAGRIAYRCVVQVQDVKYPFVGVYASASKRITYCKRDLPPIPSESIPVSARCTL